MGMKLLLFSEYWVLGCVHMPQGITYATGHYIGGGVVLGFVYICHRALHCIGGFVYICHRALHWGVCVHMPQGIALKVCVYLVFRQGDMHGNIN